MLSFEGRDWIFTLIGSLQWSSLDSSLELTGYCNSWIAQNGTLRRDFTPALFNVQVKHQMWGDSDVIQALWKQEVVNWVGLFGWINRSHTHLKPFYSSFHTYLPGKPFPSHLDSITKSFQSILQLFEEYVNDSSRLCENRVWQNLDFGNCIFSLETEPQQCACNDLC